MELDEIEELDSCFHEQIGPAFLFFFAIRIRDAKFDYQSIRVFLVNPVNSYQMFFNTNQHSNTIWNKQKATKTFEILKLKT